MIKNRTFYFFYALLLFQFGSCVSDIDFDQASDIEVKPVYELDFVYSEIVAPNFTDGVNPVYVPKIDILEDDLFSGDLSTKLERVEFTLLTKNTIATGFDLLLEFQNDADTTVHSIAIVVNAGGTGSPVQQKHIFDFDQTTLTLLQTATKLQTTVSMTGSGDISLPGTLVLKSKGTFYTNLTND